MRVNDLLTLSPGRDGIANSPQDTWVVLGIGVHREGESGPETYLHLASTSRFREQKNGKVPLQIGDYFSAPELREAKLRYEATTLAARATETRNKLLDEIGLMQDAAAGFTELYGNGYLEATERMREKILELLPGREEKTASHDAGRG